jgi:hypothetical protein
MEIKFLTAGLIFPICCFKLQQWRYFFLPNYGASNKASNWVFRNALTRLRESVVVLKAMPA